MRRPPAQPMPLYDRMKAEERGDGMSIHDLCRPLSATILPKSAMIGISGQELPEAQALKRQRATGRPKQNTAPGSRARGSKKKPQ